jgi:hypothetical protein
VIQELLAQAPDQPKTVGDFHKKAATFWWRQIHVAKTVRS